VKRQNSLPWCKAVSALSGSAAWARQQCLAQIDGYRYFCSLKVNTKLSILRILKKIFFINIQDTHFCKHLRWAKMVQNSAYRYKGYEKRALKSALFSYNVKIMPIFVLCIYLVYYILQIKILNSYKRFQLFLWFCINGKKIFKNN